MLYNSFEMNVLVKGKPITEYPHQGQLFVEGRDGSAFEIELINRHGRPVEAVVAVDGLSVIDGQEAGPQSSGYLLRANERLVIPGWKLNAEQVAAFVFAGQADSYAAQSTGSNRNTGVIGVMVFGEQPAAAQPIMWGALGGNPISAGTARGIAKGVQISASGSTPPPSAINPWAATSMTCGLPSPTFASLGAAPTGLNNVAPGATGGLVAPHAASQELGAGFGQAQAFATQSVKWERGDLLSMSVVYYDSARALKARGVVIDRRAKRRETQQPVAFPGLNTGCVPPAGWRG